MATVRMAPVEKLPAGLLPPSQAPVNRDRSFLNTEEQLVVYESIPDDVSDEVMESYASGLPAPEFRILKDPAKEKIETPLDARGLVDFDKLIIEVNKTIDPEYPWPGHSDLHHAQWTKEGYWRLQTETGIPAGSFRELPTNKVWAPRVFHNWLHAITIPPPIPSHEVMQECIDDWVMVRNFFDSVKETTKTMRIYERERKRRTFTEEQEEILDEELLRLLSGVFMHLDMLYEVPLERWPFTVDLRPQEAAGHIGGLVMRGWQRRTRAVRQREVA